MTTGPGMVWVKHMRSSECRFIVCIIIERLTSLGMFKKKKTNSYKNTTASLENVCCVYRPNDSRMLVALGESYEKLSQQAEAKKVGDDCP